MTEKLTQFQSQAEEAGKKARKATSLESRTIWEAIRNFDMTMANLETARELGLLDPKTLFFLANEIRVKTHKTIAQTRR